MRACGSCMKTSCGRGASGRRCGFQIGRHLNCYWMGKLARSAFKGAYYALTGIWPLVSLKTFEVVTGRKPTTGSFRRSGVLALTIGLRRVGSASRNTGSGGKETVNSCPTESLVETEEVSKAAALGL